MPQTTEEPRASKRKVRGGDLVFSSLSRGAALLILLILAAVTLYLAVEAIPGISADPDTTSILDGDSFLTWVLPLAFGSVWVSVIALVIAAPLAVGLALFVTMYARPSIGKPVGYVIDLLAAVPSVVYGLWGLLFLAPTIGPVYGWLNEHLGWFPLFSTNDDYAFSSGGRTILTAGIVLSIMIMPIITALCREIFLQTPRLHREAAMALGATRWEMIRMTVFPYARSGMIGSIMLGLGRALGETLAVAFVLSGSNVISFRLLATTNPNTIPARIAQGIRELSGANVNVLIAAGLVLFVITFLVNFAARAIVNRRSEFSGAN